MTRESPHNPDRRDRAKLDFAKFYEWDEEFLLMGDRTYTQSVLASWCLEKGMTTPKLKPFAGNRKQASKV